MKKIRFIPYGYTMRNGRIVIEHSEADVIKIIFDKYINGASLQNIAEELTEKKIPYTEKTNVWDKSRIARIIDNIKYTGTGEYDPIIDEDIYEDAVTTKVARQKNSMVKECEEIAFIRDKVRCYHCGSPMVRKTCSKNKIAESWVCTNPECQKRVRISDTALLEKINILMNRLITNKELIIPKPKIKTADSYTVKQYQNDINEEIAKANPSESLIISKIKDIASQLYKESDATNMIAAKLAKQRIEMMRPQEKFNKEYFSDLIRNISLSESGDVILNTIVETQITSGDEINGY